MEFENVLHLEEQFAHFKVCGALHEWKDLLLVNNSFKGASGVCKHKW